jgi:hypothetical protein
MKPDNTVLLNKLTLLVLSLILVCLVMLVIRAYQKPLPASEPLAMAEAEPASVEETSANPTAIPVRPLQPPRRPATTNTVRAASPVRAPSPVPASAPTGPASPPEPVLLDTTPQIVPVPAGVAVVPGINATDGAGTRAVLFGVVTLTGKPKPEIPIDMGPACGALNPRKVTTRHFVVSPSGGLADVLVYLKNVAPAPALSGPPLLDQVGCMFEPYVLGVVAGQRFRIRNSDPTLHNVHATPKLNQEFNLGQPGRGQINDRSFSNPELFIRLKCDVHPWMFAYVNVVSHPFFAITDTNGFFRLPSGFPAGTYTVSAIHLKAGELTQEVTLGEGEQRAMNFQFAVPPAAQSQGGVARSN